MIRRSRGRPTVAAAVGVGMLLLVAGLGVAGGSGAAGTATVGHGLDGNLTWVMLTPEPGLDDGDMENFGVPPRGFEQVDFVRVTWVDGGFSGCGAGNAEVFGLDRGNDDPGTETDESLFPDIKSTSVTEDRFRADFYDESDFGGSPPTFREGDELVGKTTGCIDTPDEPGWYRIRSTIASADGNFEARSHYFYICDCANEREARQQLGPPPSESTPTPTPTASPTPTATPTATPEPTATPSATVASDGTASGDGGGDGSDDAAGATTPTDSPTPTPPGNWSAVVEQSPTAGDGPGFGVPAALLGLLASGLLARRR